MTQALPDHRFRHLLGPLFDAGWSEATSLHRIAWVASHGGLQQIALQRSCMVVGVQHVPSPKHREQLVFVPVAAHLEHPDDGIGLFDAVTEPRTVVGVSHGLQPFVIEDVAARLGLLDPTHIELPADTSAQERVDFLVRLYGRYVGRWAAKWRGGNTLQALRALDADEPFSRMLKATLRLASAMGSTDYTSRWWGNGWWTEFSDRVLHHVEETFPDLVPPGDDEFASRRLASALFHEPDTIPDTVLRSLIDPPDGKGLRFGALPEARTHLLSVPSQSETRYRSAA